MRLAFRTELGWLQVSKLRRMLIAIANAVSYIVNIPLVTVNNATNLVTVFSGSPFEYLSYYRVRFDYSVNVKTAYNGSMVFVTQDNGAFTYNTMKSFNTSAIGTYSGSVDYTVRATKNAGALLNVLFRAYTGLADVTLTNIRVEKVG